jgi:DNA-directed RNA polymerase subunit D
MKIEIIEKKKNKLSFILKDSSANFANALRRTIINEVPTMAIEDVEFRKNTSAFYDEMIAHRLGLLPIKTDLKSYEIPEECTCKGEGCAKCQVTGAFKVKDVKTPKIVLASEIKFKDPAIKPVYPEMPIVILLKNQELEAEVTAVLGKGKNHAKWIPAHVHYKYLPVIEIGKDVENPEEVAESCPVDVFEVKSKKLAIKDLYACHLCGACVDSSEGKVRLNEKDTDFIFYVESFGQLDPEEIVERAVEIIDKQLEELDAQLK